MAYTLDVIIPTVDRPHELAPLVQSLAKQLAPAECIYIVWQGPAAPAIAESHQVKLLFSSPPNLPLARNRGARASANDLVLFLDDDVEVMPDLLAEHRRAYQIDRRIGCVAGYVDDPILADASLALPSIFDRHCGKLTQNFMATASCYAICAPGGNMSFRRSALAAAGGFDAHFVHNALWEEVDAVFRVRGAGYKVWYSAEARVVHRRVKQGGCHRDRGAAYLFHQFANTAYFAARFAAVRDYRSWIRFWKYRLEYLTRKNWGPARHDPLWVAAGMLGACAGVLRFVVHGRLGGRWKQPLAPDEPGDASPLSHPLTGERSA